MFAMTSMGAKVIDSINDGHGPYVFKISGQICHRVGSLIPSEGRRPEYAQLYIFDTDHEVSNRINVTSSSRTPFHANKDIVRSLIQMLDTQNPIYYFLIKVIYHTIKQYFKYYYIINGNTTIMILLIYHY